MPLKAFSESAALPSGPGHINRQPWRAPGDLLDLVYDCRRCGPSVGAEVVRGGDLSRLAVAGPDRADNRAAERRHAREALALATIFSRSAAVRPCERW